MGAAKVFLGIVSLLVVFAALLVSIPGLPPNIEFESFDITEPKSSSLAGWFATNTILDEAELYFENPLGGMESLAVLDDDTIFTGDPSGGIIKITGIKHSAINVTQLKYPCSLEPGGRETAKCGWPLGMRFEKNSKNLFIMDYFGGLTKVDVKTGLYENLIPKSRPIQNKIGYVPEDVDIGKDGSIYWTDGSTTGDFFFELLAQPSGRLIKYDPIKRTNEVLLENLHFSNGVCLSDDEEFVLAVETGTSSIRRYYLKGKQKGTSDIFVNALPGYPDNLRSNGRGGFYVGLAAPWTDQYSMKVHMLAPRPTLRKLILRSRHILLNLLNYLKKILPENIYLNMVENYVREIEPIYNLSQLPKTATVVELSKNGEVIGILNGKSGKIHSLSQLTVGKNYAFLNTPFDNKIWRIKLDALRRMK